MRMVGVELFAKGKWRGKPYTDRDIDDIVRNFKEHQSEGPNRAMRVAITKGHRKEDLDDPSLPKHGTVTHVYREGGKLLYDADNVDPVLAQEIRDGKYEDISAEIYDEPPEGIPGKGKMLRRVAILGADVPKIKGLNPHGLSRTLCYSERPTIQITRVYHRGDSYEAFAEAVPVSRDEMIARLGEMGMSEDVLNGLDDVQLHEIVKTAMGQGSTTISGKSEGRKMAGEKPDNDEITEDEESSAKKFAEMSNKCNEYAEKHKKKFGKGIGMASASVFSESQIKDALADVIAKGNAKVAEMFSEAQGKINAEIAANQKNLADSKSELKRQRLELFAETELRTGRLEPADLDRGKGPNVIDRWMLFDDSAVVHKFTEDGKEKSLTALDAELRAVRQRAVKYVPSGEKVQSPIQKQAETFAEGSKEQRKAAFTTFAETHAKLFQSTSKELIDAWELARSEQERRELEQELQRVVNSAA